MGERQHYSKEELTERRRISAQKYRALRNQLGLISRPMQREAYRKWCEWEAEMDAQKEERQPKLRAFWRSLFDFPSLMPKPVHTLGEHNQDEEELKEISLLHEFGASKLQEFLPWAGSTLYITRQRNNTEPELARYTAWIDVKDKETRKDETLHIVLASPGFQSSEVFLTADSSHDIFMGNALPFNWERISLGISIEEANSDDQ